MSWNSQTILNTIGDPKCKHMNKHPKLGLTKSESNVSNQVKEPKCHKNAKITALLGLIFVVLFLVFLEFLVVLYWVKFVLENV